MDITVRTAASITFKNMVKRRWESEDVISSQDRAQVKAHIIQVYLKLSKKNLNYFVQS